MKNRAGFTLAEVLIALTLTAVLGAVVTGAFVSQSRFFDHQEKVGAARAVSRGAMNIMMSEMRMIELGGGVVAASSQDITLRVPTMFGVVCSATGALLTATMLPADLSAVEGVPFSGWAYRRADGSYQYNEGSVAANEATVLGGPICAGSGIFPAVATPGVLADGAVRQLVTTEVPPVGSPMFLYNVVTYAFAPSAEVPGGPVALWRELEGEPPEELIAPFDDTAEFRFFVNDAATATTAVPADLRTITGVEIVLDGVSERPNSDGTFQTVPLTTAVYFKNR